MEQFETIRLPKDRWQEYKNLRILAVTESPEAFSRTIQEEENRSDKNWQDRLDTSIDNNLGQMFFAEMDGKLIGMVGMYFRKEEMVKHIGELASVFVLPEYRGKGVMTSLIKNIITYGKENAHIRKVVLEVTATQVPAITLYEKMGFRKVGILKDELKVGDKYIDHVYMEKLLY